MIEPSGASSFASGSGTSSSRRPTGTPFDREPRPPAVVGLHEHADRVAGRVMRDAVPIPPLKPWQIIPVPPPTAPCSTGPSAARSSAAKTCSATHVHPLDLVQEAVVGLADDR